MAFLGERIVAACVEQDQRRLGVLLQRIDDRLHRHETVAEIARRGVGGDEVVLVLDLDAVARIIQHRHIRVGEAGIGEVEAVLQLRAARIRAEIRLEAERCDGFGGRLGVVDRVRQHRDAMRIGGVADDDRDPLGLDAGRRGTMDAGAGLGPCRCRESRRRE